MSNVKKCKEFFDEGFSCSQAIVAGFADDFGLDIRTALRISQSFGGGMAGEKSRCGAVTGAYMVIGLKYGRVLASDKKAKDKTYELTKKFNELFREKHKTLECSDLLDVNDNCSVYVEDTANILEEILSM